MKNKGFTLIELLAVIVILALIALVTIPMINNVIEKAKKGALEDSVYGLKNAAELYYSTTGTSETIEFNCNENGCINGDKKLPFKGSVEDGKVKLFSDGKVSICIENDNYASSILAKDKKVTTTTGSCDYTKEEYAITELVSANEYKKVVAENTEIKNALYDKTLISSKDLPKENIVTEISNLDLNESEAENKRGLVESLQFSELGITEDMSWDEIYAVLSDRFNDVSTGTIWNFAYTGNVQTWTCPATGLYKLEVYGAQGGSVNNGSAYHGNGVYVGGGAAGGLGGYSIGYKSFKKGDKLYIVVGGLGSVAATASVTQVGGYNGGGSAMCQNGQNSKAGNLSASGGGATHIATMTGTLAKIGASNIDKILIVAGGGGGAFAGYNVCGGGTGGGTNGGNGADNLSGHGKNSDGQYGRGATQSAGGLGYNSSTTVYGSFGQGGGSGYCAGGGGGLYGGGAGSSGTSSHANSGAGGGGGSGYIGGVSQIEYNGTTYEPKMTNGTNSGVGKAKITFIAK